MKRVRECARCCEILKKPTDVYNWYLEDLDCPNPNVFCRACYLFIVDNWDEEGPYWTPSVVD
jgi:hypothetical protein